MKTYLTCAAALALGLGAEVASAQFTPPTFDGIDTDKSGSLSKEEVGVWVATIPAGPDGPVNADEVFGRWDADKDGSVSAAEFESRPRPQGAPPAN